MLFGKKQENPIHAPLVKDDRPVGILTVLSGPLAGTKTEVRDGSAVLEHCGTRVTYPGVEGLYPAFDVTPPRLVSGYVTDRGVFDAPSLPQYFRPDEEGDFPSA